jgi:hypothetical protein
LIVDVVPKKKKKTNRDKFLGLFMVLSNSGSYLLLAALLVQLVSLIRYLQDDNVELIDHISSSELQVAYYVGGQGASQEGVIEDREAF